MRVDIKTRSLEKRDGVEVEPWFKVKYVKEDFSPSQLSLWVDPQIEGALYLPAKNEFIPSNFTSFLGKEADDCGLEDGPTSVVDNSVIKIWHKQDRKFKAPCAYAFFKITRKRACSIKESLLADLYFRLLLDELNEIIYLAGEGFLIMERLLRDCWLEIKVHGFNHKLLYFLEMVLDAIRSFRPSTDRFKVIKEDTKRTLKNRNMDPLEHSKYLLSQVLCESFWDVKGKYDMLEKLTFNDLEPLMPMLLSELYIEGLCNGNILKEHAKEVANIFKAIQSDSVPCTMENKEKIHASGTSRSAVQRCQSKK